MIHTPTFNSIEDHLFYSGVSGVSSLKRN